MDEDINTPRDEAGENGTASNLIGTPAVAVLDDDGLITGWGPGAEHLLGYRSADVIGHPGADLIATGAGRPAPDVFAVARRCRAAQAGWSGEVIVRHRDGHPLRLPLQGLPATDSSGNRQWFLTTAAADQPQTATELTLLDRAFTQSPLFLALYDTDLRYVRISTMLGDLFGVKAEQVRGQRIGDIHPNKPFAEKVMAYLRHARATGEPVEYHAAWGVPGRQPLLQAVSLVISPIKDPSGEVCGVISAGLDVTEQHRARKRLVLLNEASVRIGTTLDVSRTSQELADLAVDRGLADFVTVDLLDAVFHGDEPAPGPVTGVVPLRRAAHKSIAGEPFEAVVGLGELDNYPDFSPPALALTTGRPQLSGEGEGYFNRWMTEDPARSERQRQFHVHSMIATPLTARGTTLGVAAFYRYRDPTPFDVDDLLLTERLASGAAVSVDNARRYTRERITALALQRNLLPQRLPDLSAVDVAVRYLPAEPGIGVGGDWYDVIPLSGTRVALVIGDVVGHGIEASATMGRLRGAVRTLADVDLPPAELLTQLDDQVALLAAEGSDCTTGEVGATCLYAVYDPVSRRCNLARAGHPAPALVTPDGRACFLNLPGGPPLGLGGLPFEATEIEVPEGSLLAFYTDGLIESRSRDIDIGLSNLARALREPLRSLDTTCDAVLKTTLPERPADDVALLLARTHALDPGQIACWDLRPDPALVAGARTLSARQLTAWGLEALIITTELLVSELVTNAIRYAGTPIRLRLIRDTTLICEVSDASSTAPHLRRAGALDEGGRGLLVVAQLAARWGTRHNPTGKTIWAEQPIPAPHQ